MRRVVITGMAGFSPLGCSHDDAFTAMLRGESGVCEIEAWREYAGLRSYLGAPVRGWVPPPHFDRKITRSMGRVAQLAAHSAEIAVAQAGLTGSTLLEDGRTGVAYGSCLGGPDALVMLAGQCLERNFLGLSPTTFLQMMSHSCSANLSLHFRTKGRQVPTCSACTSGSQAIGLSWEFIRSGAQEIMIAGGAEELCVGLAALFNSMGALSRACAQGTPRPFDADRDGIVIGEGAATFVLESLDHARARGAQILGEIIGFGTNSDGAHMTSPSSVQMEAAMRLALASCSEQPILDVVHAHATGTILGDSAEAAAIERVVGTDVPVVALKSYVGHTLGACGALEVWFLLGMIERGWVPPIRNLERVSHDSSKIFLSQGEGMHRPIKTGLVNTFAFGGVNTTLIVSKFEAE